MKIHLPDGQYIKNIEINNDDLDIQFADRKKIALVLVGINARYWGYLKQVIEDCRINFLPQHKVNYFVWSDIPTEDTDDYRKNLGNLLTDQQLLQFRNENKGKVPNGQFFGKETIENAVNYIRNAKDINLFPTDGIDWPAPTLMRYHLFLQEEEKLKEYDYIFYLDADMRVVDKISDEILGEGITAAEHPMYSLQSRYIPPYEPNKDSTAYIQRLGEVIDENGKPRFKPYYVAGGFQGGKSKDFLKAMHILKKNIDIDFDKNYIAIWNDESHWNKYLYDYYKGPLKVLSPSYIYPDSLIKEYYEPLWGKSYTPKIVTLTKPFSLSKQAGSELAKILGKENTVIISGDQKYQCPSCKDMFETPGYIVARVIQCPGSGKAHQLDMRPL